MTFKKCKNGTAKNIGNLLDELETRRNSLLDEGRAEEIKKQHEKGKLTARERINLLVDEGSFTELGMLVTHSGMEEMENLHAPADGIIVGIGEIDGRPVAILANDFTVLGGSIGHKGGEKTARIVKIAKKNGYPLILLLEGGGHRIQEGLDSKHFAKGSGEEFLDMVLMSGWVPTIGAIMGPGFAGPSNFASLCDFIPIVENQGTMGIAGPKLVKAALGEDTTNEKLGGAKFHTEVTGISDIAVKNDEECIEVIKTFLSYLPSNAAEDPPQKEMVEHLELDEELLSYIPENLNQPYDMHDILNHIMDRDSIFELKPNYAKNMITAFARIDGKPVGIVANQPNSMGGILDTPACKKAARFVSFCDAFHLPIISFIDVPGFLPGSSSEKTGIVRYGGKLLYEFAQTTVPKMSIIIRKAYGLAYLAMAGGRALDADLTVAWPSADICAMGIEGAVDVAFQKQYENTEDPVKARQDLIDKYRSQTGAIRGGEGFGIDDVIHPLETRRLIIQTLKHSVGKDISIFPSKRKHGISPI
ncbi:acyl-CoA carboxylase subunit beta [Oceanobacillus salinisoli]|uniref:acyl-CoA carboxylase subunit beta n=1 Tax=Oceanobacillus salinisoli TaxID=2678611 RepID=UPI0012E2B845|nr:acyl-CoA carboxylase subunit beta [Oceanobacillus salinisoli]